MRGKDAGKRPYRLRYGCDRGHGFAALSVLPRLKASFRKGSKGLLPDGETEAGEERDPADAGEARLLEQGEELLGSLPADPPRVGEPPQRRAERVEPGRPRVDHAVDA